MHIQRTRYLRGPSVHASAPVFEFVLEATADDAAAFPRTRERVFRALGSFAQPDQLDLPGAFAEVVLFLQRRVNLPATARAARAFKDGKRYLVAAECHLDVVGRAAAEVALRLFNDALKGDVAVTPEETKRIGDLEYDLRLPSSTAVIYHAARKRNIPSRRLNKEYFRFLISGQGSKQHRSQATEPDHISIVARTCSTDKQLSKDLMAAAGVPVPQGKVVMTPEDAWQAAQELGLPVAVKPQDADLQIGVSLDLRTKEQVEAAFHHAVREHAGANGVMVERFAPGLEHRVLMVDGKVAAVTRIDPPGVVGDGVKTVQQLVDEVNGDPRRGDEDGELPWHKIVVDDVARQVVAAQGYDMTAVPPKGKRVLLRRNPPYFAAGGNFIDQTDDIHPSVAAHAAAACEALQARVAGLDIVALDITKPLEEQGGAVIELNVGPGLWLHLAPANEHPRPVGESILESMYPPGEDGRIPVVALVGRGEAAATTNRYLRELLELNGWRVGHASAAEIGVNGRTWAPPADPFERALYVLQLTTVDAAVLEMTPEELLQAGFGNDRCNAAVVLASTAQADGELPLEPTDFLKAVQNALVPGGAVVTTQEHVAALTRAGIPAGQVMTVDDGRAAAIAAGRRLGVPEATLAGYQSGR